VAWGEALGLSLPFRCHSAFLLGSGTSQVRASLPFHKTEEDSMVQGGKKHMGAGSQGKGDGSGAMAPETDIPENMVLSNRDKNRLSGERGQDGKWVQTEQLHDHELNQRK
jgi:hypothetical protein